MARARVLHFVNQFFAGIGGEDKADVPVDAQPGPLGPGRRLQALLGDTAEIAVTAYCGDNYFAGHMDEAVQRILEIAREHDAGILVAGPAFDAGRYGFACVEVCHAASTSLGLGCVSAMHPENPGIEGYREHKDRRVFVFPTSERVSGMEESLSRIAGCVRKLATGARIGPAAEEGYLPRGIRVDHDAEKTAAQRAVDMVLDKVAGRPFVTEIPVEGIDRVPAPTPLANLAGARIALANTSGVVPDGNPDGFKAYKNTHWRKYAIGKLQSMKDAKWDVVHGGHNTAFEKENPNYGVPLDVCRELEQEGIFRDLEPYFYVVPGNQGSIAVMEGIGREWARDMKADGVDAVLLVST